MHAENQGAYTKSRTHTSKLATRMWLRLRVRDALSESLVDEREVGHDFPAALSCRVFSQFSGFGSAGCYFRISCSMLISGNQQHSNTHADNYTCGHHQ